MTSGMSTRPSTTGAIRSDQSIRQCLNDVPLPPRDYEFSAQQRDIQARFFRDKKDRQLPDLRLDLYDASIIAICKRQNNSVTDTYKRFHFF